MGNSMDEKRITKEFLLDLITQYKVAAGKLKEAEKEMSIWEKRIELARSQNRTDLADAAKGKRESCADGISSLKSHLQVLGAEIRRARSDLKVLESEPELSIDPEALLAGLESMGGETDPLSEQFMEEESNEALNALKEEMGLDPHQK